MEVDYLYWGRVEYSKTEILEDYLFALDSYTFQLQQQVLAKFALTKKTQNKILLIFIC